MWETEAKASLKSGQTASAAVSLFLSLIHQVGHHTHTIAPTGMELGCSLWLTLGLEGEGSSSGSKQHWNMRR